MRPLSKKAEALLLEALEKVAEVVNAGEHPNDAIVKVAREKNIPSGHINLMVHAYNTGCTTKQREAGENTLEKAADFQIADANQILDALYPKVVKTSAEIARESVVSTEYAVPPTDFIRRYNKQLEKAAAVKVQLPEKTWTPAPRDEHEAAKRAYTQKISQKREYEEIRRKSSEAYQKAADAMQQLEEYFRSPSSLSFTTVIKTAQAVCGEFGVSVLNKLAAVYPHFKKQAESKNPVDMSNAAHRQPFMLVEKVASALKDYDHWRAQQTELEPKKNEKKADAPTPVFGSILHNPAEEPVELKKANALPGPITPFSVTRTLGDTLFQGAGSYVKSPQQMREDAFGELTDPDHERKLKNIRVQGVLADLITNDSVISGYDPTEVANAYNELAEIAPNFMDSRATVQSLLRKRLEAGQLADFDIKQLLEMEKIEAERKKNVMQSKTEMRGLI
jgi:hypothetical protein